MNKSETTNESSVLPEGKKSTHINGNGTDEQKALSPKNNKSAGLSAFPITVSEKQFMTVREETLHSLNLLNSAGSAMLSALQAMPPHPDSGRVCGEYTAQAMRQLAKGICEVIQTKNQVVRNIYQIARDEM